MDMKEMMKDMMTAGSCGNEEQLIQAVYTYANYEAIAKNAEEAGLCMKEDRGFYEYQILNILSQNFKGMSKEDIRICLSGCLALGFNP